MTAGYVRLSRDDDKKNYVSIDNQKLIIQQFALSKGMVIDCWYEDDGVSGYTLDRPGFSKLIEDLDKDIDTIISKDLSRIGRHNAKVLLLLDDIKERGRRLLLVDDDYDSYNDNDDMIGIKTWYNERYIKDTSKKIKRVLAARQKEGTLAIGVPFGYMRNLYHKNRIEIVDTEADYIKEIFDYYLQGFGYRKIAAMLNEKEVPTPSMVIRERYLRNGKVYKRSVATKWSDGMISDILKNDFYIGNLRLHKSERTTLNGVDHPVIKENQLVFKNNHESIISEQTYNLSQEIMKNRVRTNYRGQGRKTCDGSIKNIFGGCLFCKNCGSRLTPITRSKNNNRKYYICNTYNTKGKHYCKYTHMIEEQRLIEDVITYIGLCRNILREDISTYGMKDLDENKMMATTKHKHILDLLDKNKRQFKTMLTQKIKDLSENPDNVTIITDTYTSLQLDLMAKIHGYEQQLLKFEEMEQKKLILSEDKLETALDVLDHIITKGCIDRKDVEFLIEKIVIDEEGMPTIEFKYGLSHLTQNNLIKELNQKEEKIIMTAMKLIYEETRTYTSAKYLSRELSNSEYKKSRNSVLPYIKVLMDMGILKAVEDKLKPYEIVLSKEELSDVIKSYIGAMSDWWYASDGIRVHSEEGRN